MGIIDFDLQAGVRDLRNRFQDPFAPRASADLKSANDRQDFPEGFKMIEFEEGIERTDRQITLKNSDMPKVPFTSGGSQKLVKTYYAGNPEASMQVMGSRENNIVIKGRLKAKTIRSNSTINDQNFREYPDEMRKIIEAMRVRGNLLRFELGEFFRYGFIENTTFNLVDLATIDYEIDFSVLSLNAPTGNKVVDVSKQPPFDINQNLIDAAQVFQDSQTLRLPEDFNISIASQIKEITSELAEKVALVTNYVDSIITEVSTIRQSVDRAEGLIKNARLSVSRYINRIGAFDIFAEAALEDPNGISNPYKNALYIQDTISEVNGISALLEQLRSQLAKVYATVPVGRHRVVKGDTLQKLSVRFYGDSKFWEDIFSHNNLQITDLTDRVGTILELPEVS